MSVTCSLSETTSSGCSCAAPATSLWPRRLPGPDTLPYAPQSFVYYATVPEVYSPIQNGREKNNKPNCFFKAFQWYTQEHGANKTMGVQRIADETKDIGFALWLDNKYQQYLHDSQLKNDQWKSEAGNHIPTAYQDTATHKSAKPKGFQRVLRSPWRKRRATVKSPERGLDCKDCKSSCQMLLKPKSLSHLASETCVKKRSTSCGAASRVTDTSSDTQITVRTYSKRLELAVQDIFDPDIKPRQTKDTTIIERSHSENTYTLQNNPADVQKSKTKIICECAVNSKEKVSKTTNMGTQYDVLGKDVDVKCFRDDSATDRINSKTDCSNKNKSLESVSPASIKNAQTATAKEKHITIDMGTDYKPESYCVYKSRAPGPCHYGRKNICYNRKQKFSKGQYTACCHKLSAEDSMQTSDYAIRPENISCGLPLLLRIVSQKQ